MKYILGNWKMYLDHSQSVDLAKKLAEKSFDGSTKVIVFPNTLSFVDVQGELKKTDIALGAQNVAWTPAGAYTGAVSSYMFAEAGASYALVGHSERRYIFGENDKDVRKKLESCLENDLTPVLCVGDTKEDKDSGKQEYRVKKQLMKALKGLELTSELIVAYEPVWAISQGGEGESCTPEHLQHMASLINAEIGQYTDQEIPLLYGGSVNEQNVLSYSSIAGISGVLVGHASTTVDSFLSLAKAAT